MKKMNYTLAEVAEAANVSPMTASRAINNRSGVSSRTKAHVLKVAAGGTASPLDALAGLVGPAHSPKPAAKTLLFQ